MKQFFINIWKRIDGNKTNICWGISLALPLLIKHHFLPDTHFWQLTIDIFTALGGGAFIHHVSKGSFKINKN